MSPEEMNARNAVFWTKRTQEFHRQLANPRVLGMVKGDLHRDRLLPVEWHKTMEELAEINAEKISYLSQAAGRNGGRMKKPDALQRVIEDIVRRTPDISVDKLTTRLRAMAEGDIIWEVTDTEIVFVRGKGSKTARLSGLKDRLHRARRAVKQEADDARL